MVKLFAVVAFALCCACSGSSGEVPAAQASLRGSAAQVAGQTLLQCSVGEAVQCPGTGASCSGEQCCAGASPGDPTFPCPSAPVGWGQGHCQVQEKKVDCLAGSQTPPVGPPLSPVPLPPQGPTLSPIPPTSGAGPIWGCGLVGSIPGISADGTATAETQSLIDGIKGSSTFNMATYWNWNFKPQLGEKDVPEYLTKDILFMPDSWGAGAVAADMLVEAGQANFPDLMGGTSPATMANILLGMNEPDIIGSCLGNMFGSCNAPCDAEAMWNNDCPMAWMEGHAPAEANSRGQCDCVSHSSPTGCGFWGVEGCAVAQPLPGLWDETPEAEQCVDSVMSQWKQTAAVAYQKGYKYLSTPMVAVNVSYARNFIERACGCDASGNCACTDASCGCPVYVVFHFYGNDCRPKTLGSYDTLRARLNDVAAIMEAYPFVQGAIINEVGMLNCAGGAICIPDGGKYPASAQPDHGCPSTDELPNGLATFIEEVMGIAMSAKTSDGRYVTKGFSWFNEDEEGGTYNLRLQYDNGTVNKLGEAYITACTKWGEQSMAALARS
mmetsp:Transcript_5511/g.13604  ORF Transcript_5511/g.13604 Transcript_5511/m.13604 type:complete len:552 (+) Transcript_5511:93-1748(+)